MIVCDDKTPRRDPVTCSCHVFLSSEILSRAPSDQEIVVADYLHDEREVQSSRESTDLHNLNGVHKDADTRMILHCVNNSWQTIVVSAGETDVFLLLILHSHHIRCKDFWMMSGTAEKRKCINIRTFHDQLHHESVPALLPYHTLTGCDSTSYFFGRPK